MNKFLSANFDNATLHYNLNKFNWPKLVLGIIQAEHPKVTSLETLHTHLSGEQLARIAELVQRKFLSREWSKLLDEFAKEYISPLLGDINYLIKKQPTLNIVIPNQSSTGRRLPFHQGIFYDNGRGQGTIWMPLTSCYDTNTMWIMDLKSSRKLTTQVIEHEWSLIKFEEECLKNAFPVILEPGQAHLFAQEHIHGNVENTTGITRLAIDWHILLEGEEYHRRYPGAFFRFLGDYDSSESTHDPDKTYVCYLSHNTEFDKFVGKHAQRCTIEHYTNNKQIQHNGYQFENEYLNHLPVFDHLLEDSYIDGIVVFSIYSISDHLLRKAIRLNKELYFANEYFSLKNTNDLKKLLAYKNFAVAKKGKLHFEK